MSIFQIILLFLFLLVILVLTLFYFFYFIRSFFTKQAPYVGTFNASLRLLQTLNQNTSHCGIKQGAYIVDLGCGDGKVLRFFAKTFHCSRCVGYDINFFAIIRGRFLNFLHNQKNVFLYHKRFEQANLADFDYIYIYLFSKQVATIEDWVFATKKPEAIVICNTFKFFYHQPFWILSNGRQKFYFYK